MVNTEVFRLAGRAGLINPFHFDIKKDGIVSLTDIALRKVNAAEKAAELSTQLRNILHEFNLWDQGHRSVKPLRDGLSDAKTMSPGNMYECLTEVMVAVKEDLSAFDDALKAVEHYDRGYATHELLVPLSIHGRKLYVDYKTGRFSGESIIKWGTMTDFYKPRRDVLNYFGKLSAGYHRLIGFREVIEREAQIPDHPVAPEDTNNHDNLLGEHAHVQ
ncbi:Ff.00g104050.m01.CDS01 [Fusarium sp. VM40]|nr:Ff.00g104050.m01.CDS01 [Fusarium sp. VM40]